MALQAIVTKYHGPTNRIGSRISATAAAGRIYVKYDSYSNLEGNHRAAMMAFRDKMKWTPFESPKYAPHSAVVTGCLPNGDYVHVTPDTL